MSNAASTKKPFLLEFLKMESAGGIVLVIAAILAMIIANSPLSVYYQSFVSLPVSISIGTFELAKPMLLWINDGLMAVFFLLVGLELKREMLEGELSSFKLAILPGFGAIGGMVIPALIYVFFNYGDETTIRGWAIPAATDIAFALGVLSLLGSRVPLTLKIFLTSIAIFDDIGAILIIAIFYTAKISLISLLFAAACLIALFILNKTGVKERSPYFLVGIIMWVAVLKSGVHATLAGIVLAFFIPLRTKSELDYSPLKSLEHDLHTIVAFAILPVFAFANAGINFSGMGLDSVVHPVSLGIAGGLFIGKQLGVFGFCWLAIRLGLADMPRDMNWSLMYGAGLLCGIGFTMSLFIGSLAFQQTGTSMLFDERVGILLGSLASGLMGYFWLVVSTKSRQKA